MKDVTQTVIKDSRADGWILPLIHGFVEMREVNIECELLEELGEDSKLPHYYR